MTAFNKLMLASTLAIAGCMIVTGCQSGSPTTAPAVTPATQPSAQIIPEQGKPPLPPVVLEKPPAASMTHVLTKDEPFYESAPGADAKSLGELKTGTKVLLMVPGSKYSKVLTEDGATVYTVTDGIDPISAKK